MDRISQFAVCSIFLWGLSFSTFSQTLKVGLIEYPPHIDFDEKMVLVEIERNREQIINKAPECMTLFNKLYEQVNGLTRYCTMRKGTTLCNIMSTTSVAGRPPSLKWPKLVELYAKLFTGEIVDGMHNSMVDVLACLRCYLQMRHNSDIGYLTLEYK